MDNNQSVELNELEVPNHIAIIMDGNGRWANEKKKPRTFGHAEGSKTLENICDVASELGVKYLTVYAFSTENWKRTETEVKALMALLKHYLKGSVKKAKKNNMKVNIIGDKSRLEKDIINSINKLEEETKDSTGLNFQIALNYGSRDELLRATKKLIKDYEQNNYNIDDINESTISNYLDTSNLPDPDLLIRTGGEQRVSNFLLWQLAYTEFYFTDKYWPDFNKKDLLDAIAFYNKIERRFGGVLKEVKYETEDN